MGDLKCIVIFGPHMRERKKDNKNEQNKDEPRSHHNRETEQPLLDKKCCNEHRRNGEPHSPRHCGTTVDTTICVHTGYKPPDAEWKRPRHKPCRSKYEVDEEIL